MRENGGNGGELGGPDIPIPSSTQVWNWVLQTIVVLLTYVTFCAIIWFLLKAISDHISHHQRLEKYQEQTTRWESSLWFLFSLFWLTCRNRGPYFNLSSVLTRQDWEFRVSIMGWRIIKWWTKIFLKNYRTVNKPFPNYLWPPFQSESWLQLFKRWIALSTG